MDNQSAKEIGRSIGRMNPDFLWGAATSSHQVEGHNDKNDWWAWEAKGRIEGGVRSGPATDHLHRFREDLKLAADLGTTTYRFSVEWSRIEPEEGRFDPAALEWYATLIGECEKLRLMPMLTLHHFTSPLWFAEQGGFTVPDAAKKFTRFVEYVAANLGPRVPLWCTLNEPMVLAVGTYLGQFMPPGQLSPKLASLACRGMLQSHVAAYDILHRRLGRGAERVGPWQSIPLQVGLAHNMMDFMPDRKWHPMEQLLARVLHGFYNAGWLDAITGKKQHFGVMGLMPFAAPVKEALGRVTADFIGVNYYTKAYVQWRPRAPAPDVPSDLPVGIAFARRKEEASDLDWAVHPQGLGRVVRFASRYKLPIYITENGIADRDDRLRAKYIESHLAEVASLMKSGVDIRGYYYWSLLDNFEWMKGFWPRFGLYHIDYETFKRTARPSAFAFKAMIDGFCARD